MLPDPARRLAEEIARDRTSGALPLALRVLEAYERLNALAETPETARELHRMMVRAQPWMVAVRNASLLGRQLVGENRIPAIQSLRERLLGARTMVARGATEAINKAERIVTISYSTDVLEALTSHEAIGNLSIYVCESRPLQEGVRLVADLRGARVAATLIADAAGPTLVRKADAVLTGADSLLRRGSLVNKIGTLSLALACREYGVPFLPLLEVLKLELEGEEMTWEEERRDPTELSPDVEALNLYFEEISPRLLDAVITDAGTEPVEALLRRFRSLGDLAAFYLM